MYRAPNLACISFFYSVNFWIMYKTTIFKERQNELAAFFNYGGRPKTWFKTFFRLSLKLRFKPKSN